MIEPTAATAIGSGKPSIIPIEALRDVRLTSLIEEISKPENQGEGLQRRDYVLLAVATVILPVVLIVVGGQL
jgi:hypothetical protein